jgi:hypothetical protein
MFSRQSGNWANSSFRWMNSMVSRRSYRRGIPGTKIFVRKSASNFKSFGTCSYSVSMDEGDIPCCPLRRPQRPKPQRLGRFIAALKAPLYGTARSCIAQEARWIQFQGEASIQVSELRPAEDPRRIRYAEARRYLSWSGHLAQAVLVLGVSRKILGRGFTRLICGWLSRTPSPNPAE